MIHCINIKNKGTDAELVQTRYFLYDKNNRVVDTELKLNNPNKARAHKLFFASELQKIDKQPKKLISQDTIEDWNRMEWNGNRLSRCKEK